MLFLQCSLVNVNVWGRNNTSLVFVKTTTKKDPQIYAAPTSTEHD